MPGHAEARPGDAVAGLVDSHDQGRLDVVPNDDRDRCWPWRVGRCVTRRGAGIPLRCASQRREPAATGRLTRGHPGTVVPLPPPSRSPVLRSRKRGPRGRRGVAQRRRRRPFASSDSPRGPREITAHRVGQRVAARGRLVAAVATCGRWSWWPVSRRERPGRGGAEAGGDDRVELRAHPRGLRADQVGEASRPDLQGPREVGSRPAGNARAVHLDHSPAVCPPGSDR